MYAWNSSVYWYSMLEGKVVHKVLIRLETDDSGGLSSYRTLNSDICSVVASYLPPVKGVFFPQQNSSHPLEKRTRLAGSVLSDMNNSLASHLELPPFRDGLDVLSSQWLRFPACG